MNIQSITVEEAKKILDEDSKVVLLDVRTVSENAISKISNSILKPLNELQGDTSDLDKNNIFLIYCATGNRSQIACSILQDKGFENCMNMSGGINAWQMAGFEIEKGKNVNPFVQMFGL